MAARYLTEQAPRPKMDTSFWVVSLCFFLSGAAGLIYQMVWMRYLSTVFGTSELAIVAVLVAYMGGLAAGAWAAAKSLHRLRRPIIVYAALELAVAVSAIAVPWLLRLAGLLHTALLGGQAELPADGGPGAAIAHLALACLVLFVPTACMGATLPILAKGLVQRTSQIGRRIGWLYALNTFGAVAGTLLAAFALIPSLGLWKASFCGVALNLVVAALGWSAARRAGDPGAAAAAPPGGTPDAEPPALAPAAVLGVMCASGAIAFVYEVLWARLLAHVLGGSFYAFATMLAAFLAGIALGGLVGAWLARDARRSALGLAVAEIATGVLTAICLAIVSGSHLGHGEASLFGQAMLCALTLMPATICLGATFPLAVRSLGGEALEAGSAAGRVYAWNTLGAIAGAVAAGLAVIPAIGYAASFKWAVTGNLLLAAVVVAALRRRPPALLITAGVACLAAAIVYRPLPPVRLLARSPHEAADPGLRLVYLATGRSATVSVLERRGSLVIRSNGLQEAEIFPRGAESLSYTHIRWLPALPMVFKPDARSLMVVGFGGGTMLESIPGGFESVDVVEIEEEIIAANRLVAGRRAIDPFADKRLNVIINDARGALQLSEKRFDAIVSQPSHPWTAGASHLYTREFLDLAAAHLNPGGVLVQWLGANFVDGPLLGSFVAAALEVFPHLQLFLIGDNFVIVCSAADLDARLWTNAPLSELSDYPKISFIEDLLAVLQLDGAGCRALAAGHPPITDDRNLMATHHLPGKDFAGALSRPENLIRLIGPLHFLNRDPLAVRAQLQSAGADLPYLTRLLKSGSPALDRRKFFGEVLTAADRQLIGAAALVNSQPDQAVSRLRSAADLGATAAKCQPLLALAHFNAAWRAAQDGGSGAPPREFAGFAAANPALAAAMQPLDPAAQALVEARYWGASGQLARLRQADAALAKFDDHRSAWFEPANELRLLHLTDATGKSDVQALADRQVAVGLLDHLLALPLERNLPLVQRRIALAQADEDFEFLTSIAWIITRKIQRIPAGAPASATQMFTDLLKSIFAPYTTQAADGSPQIAPEQLRALHTELVEEIARSPAAGAEP